MDICIPSCQGIRMEAGSHKMNGADMGRVSPNNHSQGSAFVGMAGRYATWTLTLRATARMYCCPTMVSS